MRKTIYILLAYFVFINVAGVSNVHVHHDGVFNSVTVADTCGDDHSRERDVNDREGISEHLYEHGCLVAGATLCAIPLYSSVIYEYEAPQVCFSGALIRIITLFPEEYEFLSMRCPLPFKLRAPPLPV